ncbi:WXG100 family type VII secretion target [Listeria booriae]|uniref:ESAT-6-like protein n=1 Tax=Listeria booriae TaxID=1552123 RepID=A0A7X1CMR8_9LIST|nr:WXG100 family type VII secretion target [Listeria booriae]MBC1560144.1 WXG100 family type VII secretion target [Listeria booriae]MBC1794470.1 WXG100 family type VII secretion target [Listeria booriae]MBC1797988.1 WXG100 family type VII secretion target [Listeria booriae]MBC1801815.1 WXG100 family type VII secretion target [Listeria booriae]MBC1804062.1 WXG100 family type VII secretion target [Listeria booriae]
MAKIGIDTEELASISTNLKTHAESYDDLVKAMKSEVDKIPTAWDGQAAEAYVEQFEELKPSFNNVLELIETISIQLKQVIEANENLDKETSGKLRQ